MKKLLTLISIVTIFSCQTNVITSTSEKEQFASTDTVRRKKFTFPIIYDKYKVDTFSGKSANIDYESNRTARRFRSAIDLSIQQFGTNFAGHYNLARWGCGTACINGAITNLKTGRVYDLPPAALDYEFRKDSRLLVINPPDNTGYYDFCSYCEPEVWVWNENENKFEKLN